jgi:hypothetical protein
MCERVEVVTVCVPMLGWTIALLEFKSLRRHRGKGKAMAIGEVFRRRIYGSSRIRLALRGGDEGQPRLGFIISSEPSSMNVNMPQAKRVVAEGAIRHAWLRLDGGYSHQQSKLVGSSSFTVPGAAAVSF